MTGKEDHDMTASRIRKWGLLGVPLLIGLVGFLVSGMGILDALFSAICLYGLEIQDTPPNVLVEIARWTAPIATASGFLLVISRARSSLRNWVKYRRGNSVAVYGPEAERTAFLEKLGSRGIEGLDDFVRAHRYVLLDEEERNFGFYARDKARLKDRAVYMRSSSLRPQSVMPLWGGEGRGLAAEAGHNRLRKAGGGAAELRRAGQRLLSRSVHRVPRLRGRRAISGAAPSALRDGG